MDIKERLLERQELISTSLLGVFFLFAGLSKFWMLDLWLGFEPAIIINTLPLSSKEITLAGGLFETFIGTFLIFGKKPGYFSALASLWLLGITVQVTRLGLYDLAIRDLGLLFFAISVTVQNFRK